MKQFDIKEFIEKNSYNLYLKEYRCDDIPPRFIRITEYQTVFDELIAIKCPSLFEGIIMADKQNSIRSADTSLIGDLYMVDHLESDLEINQIPNDESTPFPFEESGDPHTKSMSLHEFLEELRVYWKNIHPVRVLNQLAVLFGGLDENCEVDIPVERNRYEKSRNIYTWFNELPTKNQKKVLEYFIARFNLAIDTTVSYTKKELVQYVDNMGQQGGGEIEVKGICQGEYVTIIIDQNEWHDTPVCIIGGYGHPVRTIETDEISKKLPDILNHYFDPDTEFIVDLFKIMEN